MTERFSPVSLPAQYERGVFAGLFAKIARAIPWSATVGTANVLDYGASGNGLKDDRAAFAGVPSDGTRVVPPGTYRIGGNLTLSGAWVLAPGASLVPDSGATVTVAGGSRIRASGAWADISAGGGFSFAAGVFEERLIEPGVAGAMPSTNDGYPGNTISATASFVRGGSATYPHSLGANSELSVIGGGYDNAIGASATATTIAGGAHHVVEDNASHSAIGGGAYQTVRGAYGFAGCGTLNQVQATYGVVVGGHENQAGDESAPAIDSRAAFIGAGYRNIARGLRAAIVAGFTNIASGVAAFVGAGSNNTASGANSVVPGGSANLASGQTAAVIGGASNEASGLSSVAGGESAKATTNYSVAIGEFLEATATGAWATGIRSRAYLRGQRAHAAGYFAAKGDAQTSEVVARATTTGATPQDLDLNGGTAAPLVLPDDTTWTFTIMIAARRTDADNESAAYKLEGCIDRNSGAASTALVGAVAKTVLAEDTAAWDVAVTADTTNGALKITVTGEAGKNIRWLGSGWLTEVSG